MVTLTEKSSIENFIFYAADYRCLAQKVNVLRLIFEFHIEFIASNKSDDQYLELHLLNENDYLKTLLGKR